MGSNIFFLLFSLFLFMSHGPSLLARGGRVKVDQLSAALPPRANFVPTARKRSWKSKPPGEAKEQKLTASFYS